jgi:hypothetical protein
MQVSRGIFCALAALSLVALPAAAQDDPDPQQIAASCVEAIQNTAERTLGNIQEATGSAIAAIETLDADGAPDAAIVRAGAAGKNAISRRADRGRDRVNRLAARCVAVLNRLGAGETLIGVVTGAREAAVGAIRAGVHAGRAAVRGAVQAALG